jgi:hypothetical protein
MFTWRQRLYRRDVVAAVGALLLAYFLAPLLDDLGVFGGPVVSL